MTARELPVCTGCQRPMRPWGAKPADWPGTVKRNSSTTCNSCHDRSKRGVEARPAAVGAGPCTHCGKTMRPFNSLAADWPGTIARRTIDTCYTCHKTGTPTPATGKPHRHPHRLEPDELEAAPGLARYIARRRRQNIPATGRTAA